MQTCDYCRDKAGTPHTCPVDGKGCVCECNDDAQTAFIIGEDGTVRGADRHGGGRRG